MRRAISYGGRVPLDASAESPLTRADVVVAGHLGDNDTLLRGLTDSDPMVRTAALGGLARMERLTESQLIRGLSDHEMVVVRRSVELSGHELTTSMAIDGHLIALAQANDDDLTEVSVWALGERWEERGDNQGAEAVLNVIEAAAVRHDDALVREAAVAALGAIGAPRSVAVVIEAANDKATVRRRAVIALAPFEGPEVDAALATAREDRDWQVRQAAEDLTDPQ